MGMEGDLTWGGQYTMQCADDVSLSSALDTSTVVLTNVTPYIQ